MAKGLLGIFAFLVAALCAVPVTAQAAHLDWEMQLGEYVIVDQELRSVLTEIAGHLGVPARVSDAVKGRVHEKLSSATAKETVKQLATRYGFTWYFDGSALYFSSLTENSSRILPIGQVSFPFLQHELEELGILDTRFELRYAESGRSLYAAGPPRYLELVRETLDAANAQTVAKEQMKEVNVIYGSSNAQGLARR